MKISKRCFWIVSILFCICAPARAQDRLPSWNEGPSKRKIFQFVKAVTDNSSSTYIRPEERIAVFDNDGTLWAEQPLFQAFFAIDRAKDLASKNPALMNKPLFKAIAENDRAAISKFSEQNIGELIAATHSGMTPEEFNQIVRTWMASAEHPRFKHPFSDCVYQPMLELLTYLRENGFRTFVVSGGGVDFIRAFSEKVYGIPPEQVIGSSGKTKFEMRNGEATLIKLPEVNSVDDKEGKPMNIQLEIGRRPILAFGNSDGDLQMLQYTAAGAGARLMLLLHHDDAQREYAYDRESSVGRLDEALNEAQRRGWVVVSMKQDFRRIFSFDR